RPEPVASRTPVRYTVPTNMHTLGTQVRLRRLLRVHQDSIGRLLADRADRELAAATTGRLLEICASLRQVWALESAGAPGSGQPAAVRKHVSRSLSAIEAAIAGLKVPGADVRL